MFFRAWLTVALAAAFLLGYEWLHARVEWLRGFEPTHFFTPYSDTASAETGLQADSLDQTLAEVLATEKNPATDGSDSAHNVAIIKVLPRDCTIVAQAAQNHTGVSELAGFYRALADLKAGKRAKVRIGYYGDSTTDGDLVVETVRDALQRQYGGEGVGFVSIRTHGTRTRITVKHSYDEAWEVKNYFRNEENVRFPFGLMGNYATASASNNAPLLVSYRAGSDFPQTDTFKRAYLFFGLPANADTNRAAAKLQASFDGQTAGFELVGKKRVNILPIFAGNATNAALRFTFAEPLPIYGVSFENERGIYVDNLAKRNDSGGNLVKINGDVLELFNDWMRYDLVVLHYGANVLSSGKTDYSNYEEILVHNIAHLKRHWNNVPVLVVGSADKASRIGGTLQTDPAVRGLINAQRRAAVRTGSAFFDLFAAMGGEGTMKAWVESDPPLAAKDYVHFNHDGGKIVGELFCKFLLKDAL